MDKILLIISDTLAFCIAFFCAYILRICIADYDKSIWQTLQFAWWYAPIVAMLFVYDGLYTKKRPFWLETKYITKAIVLSFFIVFAIASLSKTSAEVSRLALSFVALFGIFTFPLCRRLMKQLNIASTPVVIIGSGQKAILCADALLKDKYLGYKILSFVDEHNQNKTISIHNKVFDITNNTKLLEQYNTKTAIIAIDDNQKALNMIHIVHKYFKNVLFIPSTQGLPLANTESMFLFDQDIFLLKIKNNLESNLAIFAKTTFDYALTVFIFPILLPILVIIGLIIKRHGDVVFAQQRMGLNGKSFICYKFKTMFDNSDEILEKYLASNNEAKQEWIKYKKLRDYDPRVTKIGKFLRKTSLDELPQIFNIIKGEMSFVGPRPYLFNEQKDMNNQEDIVLMCKPGITGLWQISGRNELDFDERVRLDVWYVTNWSLWLDIVILFKTAKSVLLQRGAY